MKTIVSYLLLGGIFCGCSDPDFYDKEKIFHAGSRESVKTTFVSDMDSWGVFRSSGLVKRGNTVVLGSPTNDFNALLVDLKTTRQDHFFRRRFSKDDHMFAVSSLNSSDGQTVTALDFRRGRVVETTLTSLARSANGGTETIIQLPGGQQHLIAAKTGPFVISTGLYEEGRYLLYSVADGSARYFLSYPDHPGYPDLQEETKAMLYASNVLRIRPGGEAFVCADMYSGVIDFCRVSPAGVERVKLFYLHYPKVDISETPRPRVEYYQDNHFGFTDVTVTEDRVYTLYSGKTYGEAKNHVSECQTLLVFDWDGNLLKTYDIDVPMTGVSYDMEENVIYGIGLTPDATLVKMSL